MNKLFAKRKADYYKQNSKYLRYVFNDHFVIVIFLLLGFLMIQYASFSRTIPENWFLGKIVVVLLSVILLAFGRLATFFEKADKQFLLAKEEEVVNYLKSTVKSSMTFPVILFLVMSFVMYPVSSKSFSVGIWFVFVQALLLSATKFILLQMKMKSYFSNALLNWDKLILDEQKRQASVMKIFSQFVDIPGLVPVVKRRKYLDGLLKYIKKDHSHTYSNLYARHFLRTGDYLGLYFRLLILSLLVIYFIASPIVAMAAAVFLNFLLIFQLLPLKKAYDYQLLNKIYPVGKDIKKNNLFKFLVNIMLVVILIQTLIYALIFKNILYVSIFILINMFILFVYARQKVD